MATLEFTILLISFLIVLVLYLTRSDAKSQMKTLTSKKINRLARGYAGNFMNLGNYSTDPQQHGIIINISKYFKIFQHNAKAGLCPAFAHFGEDEKKPFDVIYDLYKMKQFHWLLCVTKNCDWSRKITPMPNLTQASLLVG